MRRLRVLIVLLAVVSVTWALSAHAPSGAIFTTVADGSEVNFNIYPSKEAVYLDGGPGPGAPQTAAGLDDGTYVFQVTDPSGKVLLSTDRAECRQFTVANGVITAYVAVAGCTNHLTGLDIDHNAVTIQLMPYNDTPNPGGEYKVWATLLEDYVCDLNVVDCGVVRNNKHGFLPRHSKTDNFKVRGQVGEIDVRFFPDFNQNGKRDGGENWIDGLAASWTDTLGGSNVKWSLYNPALVVYHEAHVEAVESGKHTITLQHQAGCTIGAVYKAGKQLPKSGPQDVTVNIPQDFYGGDTVWIDVACLQ